MAIHELHALQRKSVRPKLLWVGKGVFPNVESSSGGLVWFGQEPGDIDTKLFSVERHRIRIEGEKVEERIGVRNDEMAAFAQEPSRLPVKDSFLVVGQVGEDVRGNDAINFGYVAKTLYAALDIGGMVSPSGELEQRRGDIDADDLRGALLLGDIDQDALTATEVENRLTGEIRKQGFDHGQAVAVIAAIDAVSVDVREGFPSLPRVDVSSDSFHGNKPNTTRRGNHARMHA